MKKTIEGYITRVDQRLERALPAAEGPAERLLSAMRYSVFNGGKRLRPLLCFAAADAVAKADHHTETAAASIEMIHAYSLIHDDLPAMDDDDLRRGKPTCHIAFDEATAILAGDALLTYAFEVLGDAATHDDASVRADLVVALAQASGQAGMVGGQMIDLYAEDHEFDVPEITRLQRMKTGALIAVSCDMGAILGTASDQARHALRAYAHDVGLAFQIADDLLDVEGDEAEVGKKTGKDANAGKATFVSLLGVERAHEQAEMLSDQAREHLKVFGAEADPLRELSVFVVHRRS